MIPFADELLNHDSFTLYEVKAMIEGEERTEVIAIGEYDHDVWDAISKCDEGIYIWVDQTKFSVINARVQSDDHWWLDDNNFIISIDLSTKTVFA